MKSHHHTHTVDGDRSSGPELSSTRPDVHVHRIGYSSTGRWLDVAGHEEEHRHIIRDRDGNTGKLTPVAVVAFRIESRQNQDEITVYHVKARGPDQAISMVRNGELVGITDTRQTVIAVERIVRPQGPVGYTAAPWKEENRGPKDNEPRL